MLEDPKPLEIGKGRVIREGSSVAILSFWRAPARSVEGGGHARRAGTVDDGGDARFAKPLDTELVAQLAANHEVLLTIEEGAVGGFGAFVLHHLAETGRLDSGLKVRTMTLPDLFIDQAKPEDMYEQAGLDARSIAACAIGALGRGDASALQLVAG